VFPDLRHFPSALLFFLLPPAWNSHRSPRSASSLPHVRETLSYVLPPNAAASLFGTFWSSEPGSRTRNGLTRSPEVLRPIHLFCGACQVLEHDKFKRHQWDRWLYSVWGKNNQSDSDRVCPSCRKSSCNPDFLFYYNVDFPFREGSNLLHLYFMRPWWCRFRTNVLEAAQISGFPFFAILASRLSLILFTPFPHGRFPILVHPVTFLISRTLQIPFRRVLHLLSVVPSRRLVTLFPFSMAYRSLQIEVMNNWWLLRPCIRGNLKRTRYRALIHSKRSNSHFSRMVFFVRFLTRTQRIPEQALIVGSS